MDSLRSPLELSPLDRLLVDLRTRNERDRGIARKALANSLAKRSRDLTTAAFGVELDVLASRLLSLASSLVTEDAFAAVAGVECIAGYAKDNYALSVRLISLLVRTFQCSDVQVADYAARIYAQIVGQEGLDLSAHVAVVLNSTLESFTGPKNEFRALAGCSMLRELAANVPDLLAPGLAPMIDGLRLLLLEPAAYMREAAYQALVPCLAIVNDLEDADDIMLVLLGTVRDALGGARPHVIHGCLLVLQAVVLQSSSYIMLDYIAFVDAVFAVSTRKEPFIPQTIVQVLPLLASTLPDTFCAQYLGDAMTFLVSYIDTSTTQDADEALRTCGRIALAVSQRILPFIDPIVARVDAAFAQQALPPRTTLYDTIGMLSCAVGGEMTGVIASLLDQMLLCPLSAPLVAALAEISRHIPVFQARIQDRILDLLALALTGRSFVSAGAPPEPVPDPDWLHPPPTYAPPALRGPRSPVLPFYGSSALTSLWKSRNRASSSLATPMPEANEDVATVLLALQTLGSFDFQDRILIHFAADHILSFTRHADLDIRCAAIVTVCKLFAAEVPPVSCPADLSVKIANMLKSMLRLAIADLDPWIRELTLTSLTTEFDHHLARPELIRSLLLALSDEVFGVRYAAVVVLGRVGEINPAATMPAVRKAMICLMTELDYTTSSRRRDESARLLAAMLPRSGDIARPLVQPLLSLILDKGRNAHTSIACSLVASLGELGKISGEDVKTSSDDILSLLVETLADQSSATKRLAALQTLSQLATSSGFVMSPYSSQPILLPMLINMLLTESSKEIRRETMRVLGFVGAIDPFSETAMAVLGPDTQTVDTPSNAAENNPALLAGPAHEDYWLALTMTSLLAILKEPSLSPQYGSALEAIMTINRSLRRRCAPYWPQLLPALFNAMRLRTSSDEWMLSTLASLISIMQSHVAAHVAPILTVIVDAWDWSPNLRQLVVEVIDALAVSLGGIFRRYLTDLLPLLLQAFRREWAFEEDERSATLRLRVLKCLSHLGPVLDDHLHLVLPAMCKTIESPDMPIHVRRLALRTAETLTYQVDFAPCATAVVHTLARVLDEGPTELQTGALDVLHALLLNIGEVFEPFVDLVEEARLRAQLTHESFEILVDFVKRGLSLPLTYTRNGGPRTVSVDLDPAADAGVLRQPVNFTALKPALETREWTKPDEWRAWLRRFSVALLRNSPMYPLRACASIGESYNPLARDLFAPAFLSVYAELIPAHQEDMVRMVELVLRSPTAPSEICQALLNMAEYLERHDKTLPISIADLGGYALRCQAYAKALHYKELECLGHPTPASIESLVEINHALEQPDVAVGILTYAQQAFNVQPKEEWYERLERWDDALILYDRRREANASDDDGLTALGRMRCLNALAQWDSLAEAAETSWESASEMVKRQIAPLAAAAAWGRGKLGDLANYISALEADPIDYRWFSAVLAVHEGRNDDARGFIEEARDWIDTELATLLGESYTRAYRHVTRLQRLAELEEVIEYKALKVSAADTTERRHVIENNWTRRLRGAQKDVEIWRRAVNVHLLVMTPADASTAQNGIEFANLARRSGRLHTAVAVLDDLLAQEPASDGTLVMRGQPTVIYSRVKLMFASGERDEALTHLRDLAHDLITDMGLPLDLQAEKAISSEALRSEPEKAILLSRIYHKIGQWQAQLLSGWGSEHGPEVVHHYVAASRLQPDWWKPWHAWALANAEAANSHLKRGHESPLPVDVVNDHVVPSIKAFYRSLSLAQGQSSFILQDTLRLLSLLFNFGNHQEVCAAIQEGLTTVNVDLWLNVIPQLMARLYSGTSAIRRQIQQILAQVGKVHPQALIYPLSVATQYPNPSKRRAASALLNRLRDSSASIVEQGLLVGRELVRVAILWHEMWHEGLEDASRLYYHDRDISAMFDRLEPLHAMMLEKGPETLREVAFEQSFGIDLKEAYEFGRQYRATRQTDFLNQAWERYYHVFRKINATLQATSTAAVDLQYASPKLLDVRDLDIPIPGTYIVGRPMVRIASFARMLDVLNSKQHPRKLKIYGDDGKEYFFLLKGHEDIRQDERVMQLFGLVNGLLLKDRETLKRRLAIQTFSVVPLSTNSGLIGWISNTDTLHMLVKDYRAKKKIIFDLELKLMLQAAPKYEKLTNFQKLEVFLDAMDRTSGQDLYRILWLKSSNSEGWLERRTTYTRSLAVMSMTGYVLGLGDRHPSNLLFNRVTGQILHVDFGDCFEIAITRDRYPETVPFRLTRMLVQAMEVSGIDGTFRTVSEHTMRVLRDHRESLLALLEAFVYDPLINWRLLDQQKPKDRTAPASPQMPAHHARALPSDETDSPSAFALDKRAVEVIDRVQLKLVGRDFETEQPLGIPKQVDALIRQARDPENLAKLYLGWCAFW